MCVQPASHPHTSKMSFYTFGQAHSHVRKGKVANDALEGLSKRWTGERKQRKIKRACRNVHLLQAFNAHY